MSSSDKEMRWLELKEKVKELMDKKISIFDFDRFIVQKLVSASIFDESDYSDISSELISELEGLRTEFLDSVDWRQTPENQKKYKEITYSEGFLLGILKRIDEKLTNRKLMTFNRYQIVPPFDLETIMRIVRIMSNRLHNLNIKVFNSNNKSYEDVNYYNYFIANRGYPKEGLILEKGKERIMKFLPKDNLCILKINYELKLEIEEKVGVRLKRL